MIAHDYSTGIFMKYGVSRKRQIDAKLLTHKKTKKSYESKLIIDPICINYKIRSTNILDLRRKETNRRRERVSRR